jgi:hypothetical protein
MQSVFREFGVGTTVFEDKVSEEIAFFKQAIKDHCTSSHFDMKPIIQTSVSNIIANVSFGRRYDYKDPVFIKYLKSLGDVVENLGPGNPIVAFPFLRHLPGDLFNFKKMMASFIYLKEEFMEKIRQHRETYDASITRDVIDKYIYQMEELQDGDKSSFHGRPFRSG